MKKCINEESEAFSQILLKTRTKTRHYRLNSSTIFWHDIYARRMNVESIIYMIKRRFKGKNYSRSKKLQNKETNSKIYYTTSTEQFKYLNEGFYKVN